MNPAPLRLYVNKALLAPGLSYTTLLYPFWGLGTNKGHIIYLASALERYGYSPDYFTLVDTPEQAEYILLPHEYWKFKKARPDLLQKTINESLHYGKPLLVDASGDVSGTVDLPNARVLRINQYRFEVPAYEIKVPVPCEDLLESHCGGVLNIRKKSDTPVVGFVGWGSVSFKQRIRSFAKEIPIRLLGWFNRNYRAKIKGVFWRERANAIFKKSSRVQTDFIIRTSYSGSTYTLSEDKSKSRQEFVENILHTDYSLVIRGDANEATRFYEVLSLGRIPVLIDTAVVLPLENLVEYREFCIFIDHNDIERAPELLADFHKRLSPEEYAQMQRKARYAYEHYLRYDAFSKYLVEMLRNNYEA